MLYSSHPLFTDGLLSPGCPAPPLHSPAVPALPLLHAVLHKLGAEGLPPGVVQELMASPRLLTLVFEEGREELALCSHKLHQALQGAGGIADVR